MPSSKREVTKPRAAAVKLSATGPAPPPRPSTDPHTEARQARTKALLEAARRREAEMTKDGYCF